MRVPGRRDIVHRATSGAAAPRRGAFTLVEMLVSLAVMAAALTVVGLVFKITTEVASKSAAYSATLNWVRQFEQQISQDLAACQKESSILVIVGRKQKAAWTRDDLEGGKYYRVLRGVVPSNYDAGYSPTEDPAGNYSDPRADILMFISNRPTVSNIPNPKPTTDPAFAGGVKFAPIRVLYGHAALGRPSMFNGVWQFPSASDLRHIEQPYDSTNRSRLPVTQWHLSRVATILVRPSNPSSVLQPVSTDAAVNVAMGQWYGDSPGDAADFDWQLLLQRLGPDPYLPSSVRAAYASPYVFADGLWNELQSYGGVVNAINSLLYVTQTNHHVATVLEEVPVELSGNLGVQMLPGCAWFHVEFLMPEDPRNSVEYSSLDPVGTGYSTHADMPAWAEVEPGKTYVFVPDTQANRDLIARQVNPANGLPYGRLADFARIDQAPGLDGTDDAAAARRIRLWPYAIRVTVRAFDPNGRLESPIVRTIVHRFE